MAIGFNRPAGAVQITTYNPTFRVIMQLAYSNVATPALIDTGSTASLGATFKQAIYTINVGHQLGNMAEWSIVLYPNTNWEQIIPLMSFVVISLTTNNTTNVLMRGFVTSINRSFNISGGTPQEFITITGSDWQKIAMYPIYFLMNGNSTTSPTPLPITIINTWLETAQNLATNKSLFHPIQVMQQINTGFFQSMVAAFSNNIGLSSTLPGFPTSIGVTQPTLITTDAQADTLLEENLLAINPAVEQRGASNVAPNTIIWELFTTYQASPWRELFFDDYPSGQLLIYRSTPWRDINGNFVQPFSLNGQPFTPQVITNNQVVSYSITRAEANVYNCFLTYEDFDEPFVQIRKTYGLQNTGNPAMVGITPPTANAFNAPSSWQTFGIRFLEEKTPYLGFLTQDQVSALPQQTTGQQTTTEAAQFLNLRLFNAMNFNDLLESGTVTINGTPTIHIGTYIYLQKEVNETPQLYYVEGVNHTFIQPSGNSDGSFLTSLSLTRGEGYLYNYYKTQAI